MTDLLELLWLDAKLAPRLRRVPAWQRLLDQAGATRTRAEIPHTTTSAEDQADAFAVLGRGEPADRAAVEAAVTSAARGDGRYQAPLLLVAGELTLALDDLEMLRGLAANASAFTAGDESLRAAVAAAHDYTSLPGLIPTPHALAAHTARIREAFAHAPRDVSVDFLDTETRRSLLAQHRYRTRSFRGAAHLAGAILTPGAAAPLLAFLPAEAAPWLPLSLAFPVRAVVEAHLHADQYDGETIALGIAALARRATRPVEEG
jgi:hypothetical protein